jgi:putative PIN family toxin of toxin-antitoxin system
VTKVVLDTSVFVSALLSKNKNSSPAEILRKWREGYFTLVMSPQILYEITEKLVELNVAEDDIAELLSLIARIADCIDGAVEATFLDDIDPDDNMFLAAAYESDAGYLVSLDKQHLLPLKYYHGTQVVEPLIFLRLLGQE